MAIDLHETAEEIIAGNRGILAADESSGTIEKRFDSIGLESTEENRRAYRDMLFTTPGLEQWVSGVILFDETIRQSSADGTPLDRKSTRLKLQSLAYLVCRLLLEKKKKTKKINTIISTIINLLPFKLR